MASDGLVAFAIECIERGHVPDFVIRAGIRHLLRLRLKLEESGHCEEHARRFQQFLEATKAGPVALLTDKANEQHYEVPAAFYQRVLGPHLKYSCCHWADEAQSFESAEASALAISCERAELANGQRIL